MNKPITFNASLIKTAKAYQPHILGLGTSCPAFSILQSDAAEIAMSIQVSQRWNNALPVLYRKSGVSRRSSVLLESDQGTPVSRQSFYPEVAPGGNGGVSTQRRMKAYAEYAGPLMAKACWRAIENADIETSQITHLVTVSCTGFFAPGLDFEMIRTLDLSPRVARTHVGFMGCHGALNGLNVARSIARADPDALVLLAAVELCSLHQQYTDDPQQLVANALFSDGAASMLVGGSEKSGAARFTGEAPSALPWQVQSHCSFVVPDTASMMSWCIGDDGFVMKLDPLVPAVIEKSLHEVIREWLGEQELTIDDIQGWAIHPGGPRIVESAGRALGLSPQALEPSLSVLANQGNMSSPTVFFILDQLRRTRPDLQSIVMLAFGPGLCIEASLLTRLEKPGQTGHGMGYL